jgi:hypothetical protein
MNFYISNDTSYITTDQNTLRLQTTSNSTGFAITRSTGSSSVYTITATVSGQSLKISIKKNGSATKLPTASTVTFYTRGYD